MRPSTLILALFTLVAVQASPPAAVQAEPAAAKPATGTIAFDVEFMEASGITLAERHTRLSLGKTETISVQQGNRTVSLETTIRAGAKVGCHKIDVTLRDRRIDATGHFAKTVWQSTSEPCTATPFVLGPKEETRVKVALKPGA